MKKRRELLFNDLSIKEISSIFSNIDEQIIDLHKCSSDDFLGLSTDFKKFYNHSKGISDNANEIFRLLSEESNRKLFADLQVLYKDLNKIQSQSRQNLKSTNISLKHIKSLLEQLYIPIKNLKQNLSTLKFLIASVNLGDFNLNPHDKTNWDNIIISNSKILDVYSEDSLECEKLIFALESDISKILDGLEFFCQSNTNAFENLLNNVHYAIIFFAEKHEEVKLQIPELTLKTENNAKNISDIITNLQYQDIIRQKIEHIQKAHNKILPELQELYEKNCTDSEKESQLFQKVKDIAGLQAAILVSANKEYQLAIEKITSKFLEIGEDMVGITSICSKLYNTQENPDDSYLVGILDRLNNSEQILTSFIERSSSYPEQIKTISLPLTSATKSLANLIETSNRYFSSTQNIISYISEISKQDSSIKANLDYINDVNKDIHQFETAIQVILADILKNETEFLTRTKQLDETIVNNEIVKKAVNSINSILEQVEDKGQSINKLLNLIISRSSSTVSEIKESIKRIRYYDLFDKSITSIIADLNHIHIKLSGSEYDESQRKENLNSMKSLYTMDEEHQIHNRIVSHDGVDTSLAEESEKLKNTDEVELF